MDGERRGGEIGLITGEPCFPIRAACGGDLLLHVGDGAGGSDGDGGGEAIEEGGEAEKVVAVAVGDVDVCISGI